MESNLLKYFELGETELRNFKKNNNTKISLYPTHTVETLPWGDHLSSPKKKKKTFLIIPSRHAPLQTESHFFSKAQNSWDTITGVQKYEVGAK